MIKHAFLIDPSAWINQRCPLTLYGLQEAFTTAYSFQPQIAMSNRRGKSYKINFIPPKEEIDKWRNDYDEMQRNFIFGTALSFDELLHRMEVLKNRIRQQSGNL